MTHQSQDSQEQDSQEQDYQEQEQTQETSKFDNKLTGVITDWLQKKLLPAINLDTNGQEVVGQFEVCDVRDMILSLSDDLRNRNDSRTTKIISGKSEEEAIQTPCPIGRQQEHPSFSHHGMPLEAGSRELATDYFKISMS